jgi:hypothetical protein
MPTPEQKLEKLSRLLETIDEDTASQQDIIEVFTLFLALVRGFESDLQKLVSETDGELSEKIRDTVALIGKVEQRLTASLQATGQQLGKRLKQEVDQLLMVVDELRSEMVIRSDKLREDLLREVETLGKREPEPELTGPQIREKLTGLKGDDRLDVSAVKGVDERLEQLKKNAITQTTLDRAIGVLDQRTQWAVNSISRKITGVNTHTLTVSSTAPDRPETGDLWVDTS